MDGSLLGRIVVMNESGRREFKIIRPRSRRPAAPPWGHISIPDKLLIILSKEPTQQCPRRRFKSRAGFRAPASPETLPERLVDCIISTITRWPAIPTQINSGEAASDSPAELNASPFPSVTLHAGLRNAAQQERGANVSRPSLGLGQHPRPRPHPWTAPDTTTHSVHFPTNFSRLSHTLRPNDITCLPSTGPPQQRHPPRHLPSASGRCS
jgi:hypothetical protein